MSDCVFRIDIFLFLILFVFATVDVIRGAQESRWRGDVYKSQLFGK